MKALVFFVLLFGILNNNDNHLTVQARVPPHPDFVEWESVHQMRRRLNITYNYRPRHIHFEECRYLPEEECRERDEMAGAIRMDERRLMGTRQGNFRVLVLLVKFSDHEDRNVPDRSHFEELFNGKAGTEMNPIGSIRDWLYLNSMGKYEVTFDVQDWRTTDNTEAFFAEGNSGFGGTRVLAPIFIPVLKELEDEGFDFSPYDSTNKGTMDHFVVVHSGYGAELGNPPDGCDVNLPADRIWAQGAIATSPVWQDSATNIGIDAFLVTGAFDDGLCQDRPAEMGLIAHEYLHGFGAPDLYDEDADERPITIGGTGLFDVMSNHYGWRRNKKKCGHLSPYLRRFLTWLEPIEITQDGFYPLMASEASVQVYEIKQNFPFNQALLIENRQPIKWDSDIEGGGIVIYFVDDNKWDQSERGYPGHPNWPAEHYMVSVIQADGLYEIEQGISPGNANDFFTEGMKLEPGGDGISTDGITFDTGELVQTGITIEVVTSSQLIMMIHVTGLGTSTRSGETTGLRFADKGSTDPQTAQTTTNWVKGMIGGSVALVGFLVLFL